MRIRMALAGNPNSGKTTLFNALTGSNQFVGNWPGVTVEKKTGKIKKSMKKGKDVSVLGKYANFQRFLVKILPHPFVMNTWCKQQKKP